MLEQPVTYEVVAGVARIELNRPAAANTITMELAVALRQAAERAAGDPEVRAVLLAGAGQRFCAGGDLGSFASADDPSGHLHAVATEADAAVRALETLEKPVVAAVHGAVAGAGLALMLAADVVVAQTETKFVFAYPGVGLTPDCGVSWLLPRAIGQQRALDFALRNRPVSAETACGWGMVTEVAEDAAATAGALAEQLAAGPAYALGQARRLLRAGWSTERAASGADEAATIAGALGGEEGQRLVAQFLAPRPR